MFLSTGAAISDHRTSRPGLIWPRGSQSLMGNFEGSNRSSRSCISTEKDDADQPRRIDKHGPMLLTGVATMDTHVRSFPSSALFGLVYSFGNCPLFGAKADITLSKRQPGCYRYPVVRIGHSMYP